jgi:hypothetical protein
MANSNQFYGTAPVTYEMEVDESDSRCSIYEGDRQIEIEFDIDAEQVVRELETACPNIVEENDEEDEPSFIEGGTLMVGY